MSGLVDRSIVIVRSHVGRESGTVGTGPVSPTGTSVRHVERERNAFVQHFLQSADHFLAAARFMTPAPFVEPSAPELGTHLGRFGTQLAQLLEFVFDIGAGTEVHGPYQIVQSVFGKVGTPVTLE